MKSLYIRIWLTVVLALAAFALASGWLWQRHLDQERARVEASAGDRLAAWAELVQRSLPAADAPLVEQADALREWSFRLRLPMALDDLQGERIAASDSFLRREADGSLAPMAVKLDDGRVLWIARRTARRVLGAAQPGFMPPRDAANLPARIGLPPRDESGRSAGLAPAMLPLSFGLPPAVGPLLLLALVFIAVAAGAYPVVRRLTSRLEALKQGVETFGGGALSHRVDESGRDEVAAVGATFNRAAERIETLVRSHQSLLANASHELRSPLARLKMALALLEDAPAAQREGLTREIDANIRELDTLVDEVLLASRLDAGAATLRHDRVDLLGLAAEEAARVQAEATGEALQLQGDERLLRRALRNLLENAQRHGAGAIDVQVRRAPGAQAEVWVCDRGPGVAEAYRERIFEAFFRAPGHAEHDGGVGLGLALVRQIALAHGGSVACEPRDGGGSCFRLSLPALPALPAAAVAVAVA